jgi:hypothetical protein
MKTKPFKKKNPSLIAVISIFFSFMLTLSYPVYAFFRDTIEENVRPTIDIRLLFGMLDESIASGDWGSDTNPYLIMNTEHLLNLYVLQNSPDSFLINEDSVFQVSDQFGNPEYVGGPSANQLFGMKSIGNEQYPFVSRLRGVTTTDPTKYIELPTGEVTDTSVFGNIQIVPIPGQVDIGLFGNVGPSEAEGSQLDPSNYIGAVSNLLLYNIQVKSTTYGANIPSHNYNVTTGTFETNHVGILVGHAQYVNLEQISVYYSQTNGVAHINAFDISAGDQAKYTTSGGIVGYYKRVVIDGETEFPVSSDGTAQGIGSETTGLGLGIVYSKDIWTFMEEKTTVGSPAPNSSYDLQTTFGNELYGADNSYFHIGVFTFAHSRQIKGKDRLAKLWSTTNSNQWTIATNGTSGYTKNIINSKPAKTYFTKKITRTDHSWISSTYGFINAPYNDNANYRYMITVENNGRQYALVRYGSTAIGVEVDPTNLVIPDGELKYYTFENLSTRVADITYPPQTENFSFRFGGPTSMEIRREAYSSTETAKLQYAVWGDLVTQNINGVDTIVQAPRPLRIYTGTGVAPTTSFMATASTSNPPYVEGFRISPVSTTSSTNELYKMQRTGSGSTGRRQSTGMFATFSPAAGFSATNTSSLAAQFRLYAVRYTDYSGTAPNQTPSTSFYQLEEFAPNGSAPTKTYNTEENVLEYTGDPDMASATDRYKYTMKSIASLEWYDNDDNIITKGDTALIMSDPTSYYYIRNAEGLDIYFGVNTDIPSPIGPGTINVPEGSIGFTVNGSATTVPKAKVHVIVATDPSQGVEQHITISRFGSGTTLVGDRVVKERFILPPPPGVPTPAGQTILGTQPIYLTDGPSTYTVYPNSNTLLVAYTFEVDVETVAVTYFLEASRGTARFVYLAGERLAANDYNPLHENDVQFPTLTGIDFVYSLEKTILAQTRNFIATVGSTDYVSSLTIPYFGIKSNPAYNKDAVPPQDHYLITAVTGFNFTYNISRVYDPNTEEKYHLYISVLANVNGSGYDPTVTIPQLKIIQQNMNFNYTENSYLNTETYEYVYSDRVVMNINGYLLYDWSVLN